MILKLKLNRENERQIVIWVQDIQELKRDIEDILRFFQDQISVKKRIRFNKGYKITSTNPAIMISLHSTILDLIAETLE